MDDKGTIYEQRDVTRDDTPNEVSVWKIFSLIFLLIAIISGGIIGYEKLTTFVDFDEYVVHQKISGELVVLDEYGRHWTWLQTAEHYPINMTIQTKMYKATFNDGKIRGFDTMTRLALPTEDEARCDLHIRTTGDVKVIDKVVSSVVLNSLKSSAPIMSTEELRLSRRQEFVYMVSDQLTKGLFLQQRVEMEIDGKPSYGSQVVKNDKGSPIIASKPVLENYGLTVEQFIIVDTHIPAVELEEQRKKDAIIKAMVMAEASKKHQEIRLEEAKIEAEIEKIKAIRETLPKAPEVEKK